MGYGVLVTRQQVSGEDFDQTGANLPKEEGADLSIRPVPP
jgi:hypothetical protein